MSKQILAPIVLFVYNRPVHTEKTLRALKNNKLAAESSLYIYSDGPKINASRTDLAKIKAVRKVALKEKWCKEVFLIEKEVNQGLAKSVILGVTEVVTKFGKVIVLEDDLVTNANFLTYINEGLEFYKDDDRLASIQGYSYPIDSFPEYFFLKGADCWGWATWKRAWDKFEPDGAKLLKQLEQNSLEYEFNYYDSTDYIGMLKDQIAGKINSWAIRWQASMYLHEMVSLYPGKSFVRNIGMDGSGVHSGNIDMYGAGKKWKNPVNHHYQFNGLTVEENEKVKHLIADWLKKTFRGSPLKNKVRGTLSRFKRVASRLSSMIINLKYK